MKTEGEKIAKPNLSPVQLAEPLKTEHVPGLMRAVAAGVSEFVQKAQQPLAQRIIELETTVAELKELQLKYQDVWCSEKTYPPNSMVTHQGGAWISKIETRGVRPGDGGNIFWRLAVKRGSK